MPVVFYARHLVVRDKQDKFKCNKVIVEEKKNVPEWFKDIILTHYDEADSVIEESTTFKRVISYYSYYGIKGSEPYHIMVIIDDLWVMLSNAVEVCDKYGCRLVPACATGRIELTIKVEYERLSNEQYKEKTAEAYKFYDKITLKDKIMEIIEEEIDQIEQEY